LRLLTFDLNGASAGSANLVVAANSTSFQYPAQTVPANSRFSLGILSQPAGETCTLTHGGGFSTGPNVTNVVIACVANTTNPLSGTYSLLQTGSGRSYVNFNADWTMTVAVISNDPNCVRQGNGLEYGVFSWNQATGALRLFGPPAIDANDSCGFWDSLPPPNPWGYIARVNDTIEARSSPGGAVEATLPAVASNPASIVGGWVPEANDGSLIVFHADGTFLGAEVQTAAGFPSGYGQERGCYTVTGGNLTLTIAASCRPDGLSAYDLSPNTGVFLNGATDVGPIPFALQDPNTLTILGRTFKRTVPN
jgi:hypothetical protein